MRALLALLVCTATAGAAPEAKDTFESKSGGALRVHRIENVVWALTAPCDKGDDTEQRQCRKVRDARAAELTSQPLLLDADGDAFDVGAWSAAKKSVPITLTGCIRCAGVEVEGKTWFVTAAAPKVEGGKVKTALLYDNAKPLEDEDSAKAYAKQVASARVQFVVKVAAKPKWTVDGKAGLTFDVIAYRVFAPCDGAIIGANPPSGPAEADKKQCAKADPAVAAEPKQAPPKLEALSTSMIQDAMALAVDASNKCFEQFGVAGKAKLKITIAGDGTIAKYEQQGDFVNTPTGACIDAAVKTVTFPRSRKQKTVITYPIVLR